MYLDKEKIQALIDQQRTILADVDYLDLDSVAKIVENFDNPVKNDENLSEGDELFRDGNAKDESHVPDVVVSGTVLTAKSFFNSRRKGIYQRVMEIKQTLLPTSVTYSGESLSAAKIPYLFETNKDNGQNLSEGDELFRRQKMFYHYTWGFAIPTSHIPIIFIFSYYSLLAAVFKSVGAPDGCKGQNIWNSQKSISLG